MKEEIFRKKSLDRIKSPESLDDYIVVTNPGVWLLLAAAVALLVGTCIWGVFGKIEGKIDGQANVENGIVICQIKDSDIDKVQTGMEIRIENAKGSVTEIGDWDAQNGICEIMGTIDVADGRYYAEIITEKLHPSAFVLN